MRVYVKNFALVCKKSMRSVLRRHQTQLLREFGATTLYPSTRMPKATLDTLHHPSPFPIFRLEANSDLYSRSEEVHTQLTQMLVELLRND